MRWGRLLTFSSFGIGRLCEEIPGAKQRLLDRLPKASGEVHSLAHARVAPPHAAAATS